MTWYYCPTNACEGGPPQLAPRPAGRAGQASIHPHSPAFDSPQGRAAIAQAALASAAFPVLYEPMNLPGVGHCVDGGIVNNTPITWAIAGGADRVIVVTGNPDVEERDHALAGVELLAHEADVAINERLFRDLLYARSINDKLKRLESTFQTENLTADQRSAILKALRWKPLDIVEIRPTRPLPGNALSGLRDRGLRLEYLKMGQNAAREALKVAP